MSTLIEKLRAAQKQGMEGRPQGGGFPYLAEVLRQAGVKQNTWTLPACQSVYSMEDGEVVQQGKPLVEGMVQVPLFDQEALVKAIRADQAGESTFPEFLWAIWKAGVLWYRVDFIARQVVYGGAKNETYTESYLVVAL